VCSNSVKVLVTDGGYKHAYAIVKTLTLHGFKVLACGPSALDVCAWSKYCSKYYVTPHPMKAKEFMKALRYIILREKVDILIPVGLYSVKAVIDFEDYIKDIVLYAVPSREAFMKAYDRYQTYKVCLELKIPTPKTLLLGEIEDSMELSLPLVLKRRLGASRRRYIRNMKELNDLKGKFQGQANDWIIQEYIYGDGYGFFALFNKGRMKAFFMHHRLREMDPSGGPSSFSESYFNQKLLYYSTKLLEHLKWHGVVMVEFKFDEYSKEFKVIEINPKFWGSLDLAITSGVNFPLLYCKMLLGEEVECEGYNLNVKYQWPLPEDFISCLLSGNIHGYVGAIVNPYVKKNISISDLAVMVPFTLYTLKRIKRILKSE